MGAVAVWPAQGDFFSALLELHEPEGLLDRFYQRASLDLRRHALALVGRSLANTEGMVDKQFVERLKLLWELRIGVVRAMAEPGANATELSGFGWWFVSAKFDDDWSIDQLKHALMLAATVDTDDSVVQRLATLAVAMPLTAVECLRLMVEGDREGWKVQLWDEHMRAILTTARQSADESARQAAETLVNRLGARGHLTFRDLLQSNDIGA